MTGLLLIALSCNSTNSNEEGSREKTSFESGTISSGESYTYTFEETGTVKYYCSIHQPDMTGKVIIKSGAADSGQVTVEMESTQFIPREITIAPQTTVEWINRDDMNHTVDSGTPGEDDGNGDNNGGGGGYDY